MLRFAWNEQTLVAESSGALTAKKLPAISDAVLAACRSESEMLENPSQCRFDPSVLLCKGAESDACLTAAQVTTLKRIYSGPQNASGAAPAHDFEPGGEADPAGWGRWITGTGPNPGEGSLQLAYARGFLSNMVFEKPDWDFRTLNFDADLKLAEAKTAEALNATDPDLGRFKAAGGKLIQYHGWYDPAIPAGDSIGYYEAVASKMGGMSQTQSFYRLFMAPGMQHCGGGVGPNAGKRPIRLAGPNARCGA